jgi:hypothetical protein
MTILQITDYLLKQHKDKHYTNDVWVERAADALAQWSLHYDKLQAACALAVCPPEYIRRNDVLEEVATALAKLPFGDTASSYAAFVREMKK